MDMAEGDGKSVGCIVRTRDFIKEEEPFNHLLNLFFVCTPGTGNCLFHLVWCIFSYGEGHLGTCQEYDTPDLRNPHGRRDILCEKQLLYRHTSGSVSYQKFHNFM